MVSFQYYDEVHGGNHTLRPHATAAASFLTNDRRSHAVVVLGRLEVISRVRVLMTS